LDFKIKVKERRIILKKDQKERALIKKTRVIRADTRVYVQPTSSGRLAEKGAHTPGFFD
jgi:hypothetical protein